MEEERKRAPKKVKVYQKMQTFLNKYSTIVVCDIKDMPTNFIHKMRKELRAIDSEVLCGKTTVMNSSIENFLTKKLPSHTNKETLEKLNDSLAHHQVCLIFTNRDLGEVTKISSQYKVEKQSKVGAASPIEVTLPAGPTGMDASQVDYFQNLRIQTKVVRNQLDIINPTKILVIGQKITLSEINLMNKFGIKPFKHTISILHIIMNGKLYDSGILNVNNESMGKALERGIGNIAAFGLASGVSNKASAPHSIANSFRNIMGLAIGCDVELKQVKGLLQAAKEAPKEAPKKEAPAKEAPKKEAKKKEPEPEEDDDDVGFGGLF